MLILGEDIGKEILTKISQCENISKEKSESEGASAKTAEDSSKKNLAKKLSDEGSVVIELVGDVGAGKTTLTRGIARGLGITEPVTSPSFTLSKRYEFPGGNLVHYDFYRLDDPGILVETLEEAITDAKTVTIIEWGESVRGILPKKHIVIEIKYNEDETRTVKISG